MTHPDLLETLRQAQRFGFFGPGLIEEAARHAQHFVEAVAPLQSAARLCDIGSGGGLPGLVIADARPDLEIVLVDRRAKRTDFLRRAVSRLGWTHVSVMEADVERLIELIALGSVEPFDAVTARGFGPPELTVRIGSQLMGPLGRIVISEPPTGDRWDRDLVSGLGLTSWRLDGVRVFERLDSTD